MTSIRIYSDSRSSSPSGGSISTIPSASDTEVTIELTKGTSSSSPDSTPHREQFAAGGVQHFQHRADRLAIDGAHDQAFKLMVVELVGILDGRKIGGVDDEQAHAARRRIAIGCSAQSNQQPAGVRA